MDQPMNRGDANGQTPLHLACYNIDVEPAKFLIRNGAAVNARDDDGDTPLDWAIKSSHRRRHVPTLLRAGAALPAETDDAYLLKVRAAGGFRQYERAHLDALVATFAPKFALTFVGAGEADDWRVPLTVSTHRSLPPEMVRRVAEYAFHVGDY